MSSGYSFDEVKQKFIRFRELKRSQLSDDEYAFFCEVLQMLPKEIVDSLDKNVDFVLLSAQLTNINPACFYRLDEEDKNKAGLIILTPLIFDFLWDRETSEDKMKKAKKAILHEIAHFYLETRLYESPEDLRQKEEEADEVAQKWIDDFLTESGDNPSKT